MQVQEWMKRTRDESGYTVIGVKEHRSSTRRVAAFALSSEEEKVSYSNWSRFISHFLPEPNSTFSKLNFCSCFSSVHSGLIPTSVMCVRSSWPPIGAKEPPITSGEMRGSLSPPQGGLYTMHQTTSTGCTKSKLSIVMHFPHNMF